MKPHSLNVMSPDKGPGRLLALLGEEKIVLLAIFYSHLSLGLALPSLRLGLGNDQGDPPMEVGVLL